MEGATAERSPWRIIEKGCGDGRLTFVSLSRGGVAASADGKRRIPDGVPGAPRESFATAPEPRNRNIRAGGGVVFPIASPFKEPP